jgi:hypothetical protein
MVANFRLWRMAQKYSPEKAHSLLGHARGQRDTRTSDADSIPLVGGVPEDAEDNE